MTGSDFNPPVLRSFAKKVKMGGDQSNNEELIALARYYAQTTGQPGEIASLSEMTKEFYAKRDLLISMYKKLDGIEMKANFRSKLFGYGICAGFALELAIIMEGTFVSFSWVIMEPISYCMILANFNLGFLWFYMNITNPDLQQPTGWMYQR